MNWLNQTLIFKCEVVKILLLYFKSDFRVRQIMKTYFFVLLPSVGIFFPMIMEFFLLEVLLIDFPLILRIIKNKIKILLLYLGIYAS